MFEYLRLEIQSQWRSFEGLCRIRKANGELRYRYGQSWTFKIRYGLMYNVINTDLINRKKLYFVFLYFLKSQA